MAAAKAKKAAAAKKRSDAGTKTKRPRRSNAASGTGASSCDAESAGQTPRVVAGPDDREIGTDIEGAGSTFASAPEQSANQLTQAGVNVAQDLNSRNTENLAREVLAMKGQRWS
jgi:hypothetical protein